MMPHYIYAATLVYLLLSITTNGEVLTYTNASLPPSNVIQCQDPSTVCIINCDSSGVCDGHELHCHETSEMPCVINFNADYAAVSSIVKTHQSLDITINSLYQYAGQGLRVHAYDRLGAQLRVKGTTTSSLQQSYYYGPLGHNSLLNLECLGWTSCFQSRVYADWTTTVRLKVMGRAGFKQSQIRNLFDSAGLGLTRADYGTGPEMDYRATLYILVCSGGDTKEAYAGGALYGVNWGAYYIRSHGSYVFMDAYVSITTDSRVDQSVLYPVNIEVTSGSSLRRGTLSFGPGADVVIQVRSNQGIWYENVYARSANSLTINCVAGLCAKLNIEMPVNDNPNSFNWICNTATCYDGNQNYLELTAGYNCNNYYISPRVEGRIYCGYDQTSKYCDLYPNHTYTCRHPVCGADCPFTNVFTVDTASITAELNTFCSDDAPVIPPLSVTQSPSNDPTQSPSNDPTQSPSNNPTPAPSQHPSASPIATFAPSNDPTQSPSNNPIPAPSRHPSASPFSNPTSSPSGPPTLSPSVDPTQSPSNHPTQSPTLYPIALTDISDNHHTTNYEVSIEIISCQNEEGGGDDDDDDDTTCSLSPDDISALEEGVESATKEILVASGAVHIVGYEIIDNEVVIRLSVTLDSDANALEFDEIRFHIEREISDMEKFGDVNVEREDAQEVVEDEDAFHLQYLLYNPLIMGSVLGFALLVLICCLSVGIFCWCNKKKAAATIVIQQIAADQVGSAEAMETNPNPKETDGQKPNAMDTAGIISFQDKLMVELEEKHVAQAVDMREGDAIDEGDASDESDESDEDLYGAQDDEYFDAEDAEPVWKATNSPGEDGGNRANQTRGNATDKGENGEKDGATRMAPPPVPNVLHTPPGPPLIPPPVPQHVLHMVIDHAINDEVGIVDEGNKGDVDIVQEYRDKYGTDPQNVTQLMKFSKTDKRYKPLSYQEAKSILDESSGATAGGTKGATKW